MKELTFQFTIAMSKSREFHIFLDDSQVFQSKDLFVNNYRPFAWQFPSGSHGN